MKVLTVVCAGLVLAVSGGSALAGGDAERGAKAFRKCVTCHSLVPGRHMTGPSLAGLWGRKAGAAEGFMRYSHALKNADAVWDAATLDAWLESPQDFIPKNRMTFSGIKDKKERDDLIVYLTAVGGAGGPAEGAPPGGTATRPPLDLKEVREQRQVKAIRYCGDTYTVTTAAGETVEFWEFNLRFKSDSSDHGPPRGTPVILRSGMMGDRSFVIFSAPEEISPFIERRC